MERTERDETVPFCFKCTEYLWEYYIYISEGYIDGLVGSATSKETDVTACGYYSFYNKKKYKVVRPQNGQDGSLLNGCFWAKTFKRELFSNIMLPEGYWYEDSILAHLIYPKVTRYSSVDTCEYAYRKNPKGITETSKRQKKALTRMLCVPFPQIRMSRNGCWKSDWKAIAISSTVRCLNGASI